MTRPVDCLSAAAIARLPVPPALAWPLSSATCEVATLSHCHADARHPYPHLLRSGGACEAKLLRHGRQESQAVVFAKVYGRSLSPSEGSQQH